MGAGSGQVRFSRAWESNFFNSKSFLLLVLGVFVYLFVSVIIAVWNGKKEVGFKNEY